MHEVEASGAQRQGVIRGLSGHPFTVADPAGEGQAGLTQAGHTAGKTTLQRKAVST